MPTKAQLQAELEALRHNYDLLETKVVRLEEARDALNAAADARIKLASRPQAFPRPTFEFDPDVPGDFKRASALAKANNGVVKRARPEHA